MENKHITPATTPTNVNMVDCSRTLYNTTLVELFVQHEQTLYRKYNTYVRRVRI
jgi:hypothetical protein